jgi:hypothetical protein
MFYKSALDLQAVIDEAKIKFLSRNLKLSQAVDLFEYELLTIVLNKLGWDFKKTSEFLGVDCDYLKDMIKKNNKEVI